MVRIPFLSRKPEPEPPQAVPLRAHAPSGVLRCRRIVRVPVDAASRNMVNRGGSRDPLAGIPVYDGVAEAQHLGLPGIAPHGGPYIND